MALIADKYQEFVEPVGKDNVVLPFFEWLEAESEERNDNRAEIGKMSSTTRRENARGRAMLFLALEGELLSLIVKREIAGFKAGSIDYDIILARGKATEEIERFVEQKGADYQRLLAR